MKNSLDSLNLTSCMVHTVFRLYVFSSVHCR